MERAQVRSLDRSSIGPKHRISIEFAHLVDKPGAPLLALFETWDSTTA
jgi:hypothetical protein